MPGLAHRLRYRPRWLTRQRLSTRLVVVLLLLLSIACGIVATSTYVVMDRSLLTRYNYALRAASQRYAACIKRLPLNSADSHGARPRCGDILGQATGTFGAQLEHGRLVGQEIVTVGNVHLGAADEATLRALPVNGHPYTRALPSIGGDYRLMAVPDHRGNVLVTGLPLWSMEKTLSHVEFAEILLFAGVVLVVGVLAVGLVRWSLRPLRHVASVAMSVSQMRLDSGTVQLPDTALDDDPHTETGQVGLAFNLMLEHVQAALARRTASEERLRRFAADASHELRTPLATIRGYAELTLRHRGALPGELAHSLQRIQSESVRMGVLVDELLLLARLDAGRPLARGHVDLTRLVIDATSDARVTSPDHRWVLRLPDEPVMVFGDEDRLRQVLVNLLSNAGRHTPPGTTVTVAVADARPAILTDPPLVELTVTDDGPGIPDSLLPNVFDRFVRTGAERPSTGGAGLGLAIVRAVVRAHHGNVLVSSQPGRTCFTITLPR